MIRNRARGFAAFAFLGLAAAALLAAAPPAYADDESPFVREAVFEGPSDLVWRLLTTEDGVESWLAPHAEIDLRVGGLVKTSYDSDGRIGDGSTIVNRVLSLTPGRAVSVRLDRAPSNYPMANMVEGTWYEVSVQPLATRRSRVRCVGHGLPTGYAAMMVKPMFDRMADMVYDHLRGAVDREARRLPPPAAPKPATRVATRPATKATPKATPKATTRSTPAAPPKSPAKRTQ